MPHEDASVPKLVVDTHVELGPAKRRHRDTISRHEKRRNEARLIFNKIIRSHYRDTGNDYTRVGALFITWEVSDLRLDEEDSEVNQLRSIFSQDLGYETDAFQIPLERPESALNLKIAEFVHKYDDKNTLLVLYYAGHGFEDKNAGLSIASLDQGDGEHGDPQAFFPDVLRLLHVASSDVLLILDCCFSAKAFSSQRHGRRKFELLASSSTLSPSPGRPGSFTGVLIKVLRDLLKQPEHQRGFSTSILYSYLYHSPDLKNYKPLLFDQSQFDYGKIWLRPRRPSAKIEMLVKPSDVSLDLKIHLSLTKDEPVGLAMNELAKGLQYLPHVHHIDFTQLHAGDEDVEMFLQVLKKASIVKKVIRILKERVKERRRRELEAGDPMRRIQRPASFNEYLTKVPSSSTQDWSSGFARFSNGTVVSMKTIFSNNKQQSSPTTQTPMQSHQRRRTFWIPGIVYIRYIIDFTGIWFAVARLFDEGASRTTDQGSGTSQRHSDNRPMTADKPDTIPHNAHHANDAGREWKHNRRRQARRRILERVCWVVFVCAVYLWSIGKI